MTVKEVRGLCALGYRLGDGFVVERFYIKEARGKPVCLHALGAMLIPLSPFLKGVSARELGIGPEDNVDHVQCPGPWGDPVRAGEQ